MCKRVYISYRWQEPVDGIARNWLAPSIEAARFRCVIDVKNCGYKARIDKFEEEIGDAERIIMLLSDGFFHSDQCMYEAALVTKAGNLGPRLFPVNIGDYRHDRDYYDNLLKYWEEKEKNAREELLKHTSGKEPYQDEYDRVSLIIEYIGKFWSHVTKENFLDFSAVSKNNFEEILKLFGGMTQVVEVKPLTAADVEAMLSERTASEADIDEIFE